ncbi:ubiquitin-conjugating enzyme E2 2-like [Ctenocephalides felis]|uniref:ubiquitin-conjugating enzyme E2 2-like n=1 Tax=Ctenocephalides felis TaxID=7515 RepID=UPI000E6E2C6D|nr:ubiquitin-conjugating enzyme E2 2-like [Ctenocephalides felis]
MTDFKRLENEPLIGITGSLWTDNIKLWNAVIFGVEDTRFKDDIFKLTFEFAEKYLHKPPIFYTYTMQQDIPKKMTIAGLNPDITEAVVFQELKAKQIKVNQVVQIKKKESDGSQRKLPI